MVTKLPFFCLTSEYYSLSVLSVKLYFFKIGPGTSKVMAIYMHDAENVEFKFSKKTL